MNKAKSSVNAQMAVKCFKCKLPSSYSCWANSAQMKLPAPKLKHSHRMAKTAFNLGFHNEGYTWERQTNKETRLIYTALQRKTSQDNVSPIIGKGGSLSTKLNDQLCSLTHGLFHLLNFPFEIISSNKEGKKKNISLFLLQDEEKKTQREGRREQINVSNNKTWPKQLK